jgi:hypothetical protein
MAVVGLLAISVAAQLFIPHFPDDFPHFGTRIAPDL